MFFATQPRLSERTLADIAVVNVPATLKSPVGLSEKLKPQFAAGYNGEELGWLSFTFSAAYFWASFGSVTTYKRAAHDVQGVREGQRVGMSGAWQRAERRFVHQRAERKVRQQKARDFLLYQAGVLLRGTRRAPRRCVFSSSNADSISHRS